MTQATDTWPPRHKRRSTHMDDPLMGKQIVVTGATSGIGLALAEVLAKRGAAVLGVGRSPERCARAE
jgi:short-subunit dehydrogenase